MLYLGILFVFCVWCIDTMDKIDAYRETKKLNMESNSEKEWA